MTYEVIILTFQGLHYNHPNITNSFNLTNNIIIKHLVVPNSANITHGALGECCNDPLNESCYHCSKLWNKSFLKINVENLCKTRNHTWTGFPLKYVCVTYKHACMHTYAHMHTHMHSCIHAHLHTCTYAYAYMHTYAHIHTHTCIHAYTPTCIHAHMHTCTYAYAYMHTCMYACIHTSDTYIHWQTYRHMHINTHIHTYIHTHKHTHMWTYIHTHTLKETYKHTNICTYIYAEMAEPDMMELHETLIQQYWEG
jgi:hypothetical protein